MRSALLNAATTAAAKFTSRLGDDKDFTSHGTIGKFDMYLFAQSWAPRFCCTSAEKCAAENMQELTDLSIHGLWPAYQSADSSGNTYPAFCVSSTKSAGPRSREIHEWEKHGTCSGLNRTNYFAEEKRLAESDELGGPREALIDFAGDSIPVEELLEEFGGEKAVALKSDQFCRLEEITTCWEKKQDGTVGDQINCPDHVLVSARNSALVTSNCSKLWLDLCRKCKFIDKNMLKTLRGEE